MLNKFNLSTLGLYNNVFQSSFYSYIYLNLVERLKFVLVAKVHLTKFSINIRENTFYKFNNVFINPYFYTYYNQNILSRMSKVLNIAAKTEVKNLKLIRN